MVILDFVWFSESTILKDYFPIKYDKKSYRQLKNTNLFRSSNLVNRDRRHNAHDFPVEVQFGWIWAFVVNYRGFFYVFLILKSKELI